MKFDGLHYSEPCHDLVAAAGIDPDDIWGSSEQVRGLDSPYIQAGVMQMSCWPQQVRAKWRSMSFDEARVWLLKDMGLMEEEGIDG